MSILSGFKKIRRHIRLPDGYKLLSFWTSSQTVEMDDGTTLESNKTKWDDASTKKHEHTNKPALDSITPEKVAKWNTLSESNVTGIKGNAESSYRTGNVNLSSANIGALSTTGGTLTGNLSFKMNSSTQTPLKIYGGDTNGQGISVGAGGAAIIGGGKSAKALESVVSATNEELHLASDNNIYFDVNCNTIANRLQVILDKSRNFYPATNNNGAIGTSSHKWANMYATTFHGALDGAATKAAQDGNGNIISNTYWNKTTDLVIIRDLSLNQLTVQGNWDARTTGTVANISNYKPIAAIAKDTCSADVCWMYCYLDPDKKTVRGGIKNTVGNDKTLSPIAQVIYLRTS